MCVTSAMMRNVLHRLSNEHDFRERSISDYKQLKQDYDALAKEKEKLLQSHGALNEENGRLQQDCDRLRKERNLFKESSSFHQMERDDYLEKYSDCSKKFEALLEEHKGIVESENQKLEAMKQEHEAEMKSVRDAHEAEKSSLVEKSVRDYRQSEECYDLKARYGAGFLKIGFYKARHLLESLKGESFPELVYTEEIESASPPNWRDLGYAPNDADPEAHLFSYLRDDLQNLTGPWAFFGDHGCPPHEDDDGGDGQIEALHGLDEDIGQDLPDDEAAPDGDAAPAN